MRIATVVRSWSVPSDVNPEVMDPVIIFRDWDGGYWIQRWKNCLTEEYEKVDVS